VVRGTSFADYGGTCADTGGGSSADGSVAKPLRDVRLVLHQGAREWTLATVDADRDSSFTVRVRVPADAEPGRAFVTTDSGSKRERIVVLGR
jgi:hypothetical protein